MADHSKLTLERIHDLRACLPDLAFDPQSDPVVPVDDLLAAYLDYYSIDLSPDHFHRMGRVVLPPYTIAVHYWLPDTVPAIPEKGMVFIVHGYFDHMGLYEHLTRHLLDLGYGVIGFDLPGHGLSSGERASIESFDHYVDVFEALLARAKERLDCPLSAIGQSTGGAILLKHLATCHERHHNPDLDKVTLLAPLVEPAFWWFNKLIYKLTHNKLRGIRRKFRKNSADDDFYEFLKNDPLQPKYLPMEWLGAMRRWVRECRAMEPCDYPLTIIQGRKDTTLAWKSNIKLLEKKFPKAEIVLLDDVQHHMANEIAPLREKIFNRMGF